MSKKKKVLGANGEELELELQKGASEDEDSDKDEELDEKEENQDEDEDLADSEESEDEQEEEEEALELDWACARTVLKAADASCSHSIDDFDRRAAINALKARYNERERTQSLFNAIMAHNQGEDE